jgi:tRNA pseudouridine38-40 synthase
MSPFHRNYALHARRPLDVRAMREAAAFLVGRHDFAAFTANPNREIESTVRELTMLRIMKRGPEIVIIARGEGFLYRMARSLAGFLIRVGEGAVPPEEARAILGSRTRTARVPTAPAAGLFLWNVWY